MSLFLLALCAHLVGDFLFQTESTVAAKNAGRLWAHLVHGLLITVLTWLATHCFGLGAAFCYALLVGLAHLLIDSAKSFLEKGRSAGTKLFLFLIDQGFHWLSLLVFLPYFPPPSDRASSLFTEVCGQRYPFSFFRPVSVSPLPGEGFMDHCPLSSSGLWGAVFTNRF